MSFSSPAPLRFYFLVWSPLLADRANSVMILKTCEALARQFPAWTIDLRFTELPPSGSAEALRTLGVERLPNMKIGLLFPSRMPVTEGQVSRVVSGSQAPRVSALRRAWASYWEAELARAGEAVLYTRNPPLLEFFRSLKLPRRVPLVLELHQLKHAQRAADLLLAGEPGGLPPSLARAKEVLRRFRCEEARTISGADLVFAISGPLAERVVRMTDRPVRILRSAVSLEPHSNAPGGEGDAADRDLDLLYTGQLYYWKGLHTVIEALRHCRSDVRLTVVGGNDPADLHYAKRLAENFRVAERIEWVGQVPHGAVAGYQRRAKVGVVPLPRTHRISRWYTSPIKVFEMMSAQLPLLVSDLPSMRDFLDPGTTAQFVEADNPRAWGEAINLLLGDAALRTRLAENAAARIPEFSFTRRAAQIAEAVESLRSSGAPLMPGSLTERAK